MHVTMWVQPRPLQRVTFAQRVAFPGMPVVWWVLFIEHTIGGFLTRELRVGFACAYVLVAAWYGTLRELSARADEATLRSLQTLYALRTCAVRLFNTVADAGAAACYLFFVAPWVSAAWFPLLFFVTVAAHAVTEAEVAQRLRALYAHAGYWGGRKPTVDERHVLQALGEIDDVEVSVQKVNDV